MTMATDKSLVYKANKKQWKGLKGGAGGDVRGGSLGALAAGNYDSQNTQATKGGAAPATRTSLPIGSGNVTYGRSGAANATVVEKWREGADSRPSIMSPGSTNEVAVLGDSFHHSQYESGTERGIDDLNADTMGATGLTSSASVAVVATPGVGQIQFDWVAATTYPQSKSVTGGRLRVIVYQCEDVVYNPNGQERGTGKRGIEYGGTGGASAFLAATSGGIMHESVTAMATETKLVSGLAAGDYAVAVRTEMPIGDPNQAGGTSYNCSAWQWPGMVTVT
jgi:hypothetical protein